MMYSRRDTEFIAHKHYKSKKKTLPTVVFLHGLMSDMNGAKAESIMTHCIAEDISFMAFDNFGHGASAGNFTDQTMTRWVDCALRVIERYSEHGVILIGSSAGAWTALRVATLASYVKGLILLAPAPDFTEHVWHTLSPQEKLAIKQQPIVLKGIPFSYNLIEDGRHHLILHNNINITLPVHIIHGILDQDVPYSVSETLLQKINSERIVLKLVKDGEHRLSRPQDLMVINNSIREILLDLYRDDVNLLSN